MTADIITLAVPKPHSTLHAQVAHELRQMLVENRIAPGAKLNERELCDVLKVSRTPLREAIKMLAAEGLVDLLPNRGAIAVALTQADVFNTFEVMAALEAVSGALAAQRITEAELSEIKAKHFEMLAAYTRRDLSAYYQLNAQIHLAINLSAKNPVLSVTCSQLNARLQALRFRSNQDDDKWHIAVREHGEMLDALSRRDSASLAVIMQTHLLHKRDVVLALMQAGGLGQAAAKA